MPGAPWAPPRRADLSVPLNALEKAAVQEETTRSKGARSKDKTDDPPTAIRPGKSDSTCEDGTGSG